MEPVTHTCGQRLWRIGTGGIAHTVHYSADRQHEIDDCPQCGASLCDTDCTDLAGVPLAIPNQSEWSKARRRARGWEA